MFGSFAARLTRGYAAVAVGLILAVVGTSTALAFLLYSGSLNESLSAAAQRAAQEAAHYHALHYSLAKAAPAILAATRRARFRVAIFDDAHHLLASSGPAPSASMGARIAQLAGSLAGLHRARVPVSGGTIVIAPDVDRFGQILLWYWSIMLPVGAIAVAIAWWIGRRISARATGPLVEVTTALQAIAAGDFMPERLLGGSQELAELTTAYNDVARALTDATMERRQSEAQMRQFIADAGHELRTPLTVIMGYLDVLRGGIVTDASGTSRVYGTMLEESRRMRGLIERLIFLARLDRAPEARNSVALDLVDLARSAAEALEPLDRADRICFERLEPATVLADEAELREAVKNVIDNALKYARESPVSIGVRADGANACVTVADQGPGMNAGDLEHAFDRFYRGAAKEDSEGSGLGLAIAKRAVERAGGTARIESWPGNGTRVTLCLPRFSSSKPLDQRPQ